jgi:serine/threonine protein phosphatase PrpC
MSRSIGDIVAGSVGVIPEPGIEKFKIPEFFELELNPCDKFIVLASDGLWEFMKNEEVLNLVVPFWEKNDPEGACDRLVKEAVLTWKKVRDSINIVRRMR